ncbi:MAG: DUF1828 domain-containing protein [Oscillospiraceae bacterium]
MSKFVDEYLRWLKNSITEKELENCIEITTPFLDRHNDWIQIYIEEKNDNIYLTDDGYTIEDLITCGCDITTPTRKKLLQRIVNGYGIKISDDNELYTNTTPSFFPQKKHALIQCMMAINDLYMTSRSNTISIFADEIKDFFNEKNVIYSQDVSFVGQTGFNHKFDFLVPKIKDKKETIIKSINSPTKDKVLLTLFQWEDTQKTRADDSQLIIFLNDNKKIPGNIIESCNSYKTIPIPWGKRDSSLKYLSSVA